MEIPVISRISGFEAGINRLQNPSLISRAFHLSRFEGTLKVQSLWTWGALILALIATFSSVMSRIKLVIFRYQKGKSVISETSLRTLCEEDDDDNDDDDDETYSLSSLSSSDDEDESTSPFERHFDEDFRVAGCGNYKEEKGQKRKVRLSRRNSSNGDSFSWSDFVNGKSVVKSWDGLGLGLGFEKASESLISLWDLNKNEITSSFSGGRYQIPVLSMPSPTVIVSAGLETGRNVALRVWDTRVGRQIPQLFAEWQPRRRKIVGIDSGETERDYVRDDDVSRALAVRDIRKLASPLDLTESDLNTWWDSDAVIIDGDREICSLGNDCGSVVSRCRNAVFSYLF